MALLLGAFVLIGIQPGAKMVGADLDKTFVIIWSLAIANVGGALLCILLAGPIAKLTLVRYAYLAPLITVLMVMTAFRRPSPGAT
jgi:TctA family transporter